MIDYNIINFNVLSRYYSESDKERVSKLSVRSNTLCLGEKSWVPKVLRIAAVITFMACAIITPYALLAIPLFILIDRISSYYVKRNRNKEIGQIAHESLFALELAALQNDQDSSPYTAMRKKVSDEFGSPSLNQIRSWEARYNIHKKRKEIFVSETDERQNILSQQETERTRLLNEFSKKIMRQGCETSEFLKRKGIISLEATERKRLLEGQLSAYLLSITQFAEEKVTSKLTKEKIEKSLIAVSNFMIGKDDTLALCAMTTAISSVFKNGFSRGSIQRFIAGSALLIQNGAEAYFSKGLKESIRVQELADKFS